jgi:hypothetical protein
LTQDLNGTPERKKIDIVPIGPGEAHLQNEIIGYDCYVCGKKGDDMALIRIDDKRLGFACLDHPGIVAEFISQYRSLPLGWVKTIPEE